MNQWKPDFMFHSTSSDWWEEYKQIQIRKKKRQPISPNKAKWNNDSLNSNSAKRNNEWNNNNEHMNELEINKNYV